MGLSVFAGLLSVAAMFGLLLAPTSMASVFAALGHVAPRMFMNVVRERLIAIHPTSTDFIASRRDSTCFIVLSTKRSSGTAA